MRRRQQHQRMRAHCREVVLLLSCDGGAGATAWWCMVQVRCTHAQPAGQAVGQGSTSPDISNDKTGCATLCRVMAKGGRMGGTVGGKQS